MFFSKGLGCLILPSERKMGCAFVAPFIYFSKQAISILVVPVHCGMEVRFFDLLILLFFSPSSGIFIASVCVCHRVHGLVTIGALCLFFLLILHA